MVKIRLLKDLPVGQEHGLTAGRVVEAEPVAKLRRGYPAWWAIGDTGEQVGVLLHEAETVEDTDAEAG